MPADWVERIENLQAEGKTVCFVGDSVAYADTIAQADVSISIDRDLEYGDQFSVAQIVLTTPELSKVAQLFNTSFVERNNLTCRQCNGRLSRKVLSYSKDVSRLENHLWLSFAYYHFVLPHHSLAQELPQPEFTRGALGTLRKYRPVTPAMMAGLTDHVWTMEELLSFRVPPCYLT